MCMSWVYIAKWGGAIPTDHDNSSYKPDTKLLSPDRQTDRQTGRQTDKQTDRQTDRWTDRRADKQTTVISLVHTQRFN